MGYSVTTFDEIIADLEEAAGWFRRVLGLQGDTDRLGEIRKEIARIKSVVESKPSEKELFERVDQVTAYHSWIDALAFVNVWRAFSELSDQALPRELLKRAIKGPLSPANETTRDSDARNILFQLEYAADLALQGVKIDGFDDVQFEFEGTVFLAECKRPWSDKVDSIQRTLGKAASQLVRHLDGASAQGTRGLIVVAIDSIAGLKSALPMAAPVASEADVIGYTRRIATAFNDTYGEQFVGLDGRITAVVVVGKMPVHTLSDNTFGPVFIPTIIPLVQPGSPDHQRLQRLAQYLSS